MDGARAGGSDVCLLAAFGGTISARAHIGHIELRQTLVYPLLAAGHASCAAGSIGGGPKGEDR
jgi:hypothetical protein